MNKKEKLIKLAKELEGTPYKYGAKMKEAPNVFDCSGFIKYLYQQIDKEIPRSTIEQAEFAGEKINKENIKPGDLIFFRGSRGHYNKKFPQGIGHVVMYLGDNKIIHAESKRIQHNPKIVEKGQVKTEDLEKVTKRLKPIVIIKRIL
ncbi:MAG TPA: C40 family peptidase [Candidatus Paceibacterota bacterium]|nr:C40 family peptidase [Candidatus Paceibacterota bacterium]